MERVNISENYFLDEIIDPHTYFNTKDNGRSLIDQGLINSLQLLRELYGKPLPINNWWGFYITNKDKKGIIQIISEIENSNISKWSGYRSPRCTIGAPASSHRLGKGGDPKGNEDELFEIVKKNAVAFYKVGLRRLESPKITNGWLHMDTNDRNCVKGYINVVDLKSIVEKIKAF